MLGTYSVKVNGPVPTIVWVRSPVRSTSSWGTIETPQNASLVRNDASGDARVITTVASSGVSIVAMPPTYEAEGEAVSGFWTRSKL